MRHFAAWQFFMRGHQMIRKAIRSGVTALAAMFLVVPQVSLAQAANDQVHVDPLMQKAARIRNMNSQMRITQAQREEAAREQKANVERVKAAKAAARAKGIVVPDLGIRGVRAEKASNGSALRAGAPRSTSATALPTPELNGLTVGQLDTPDYFTTSNWAFSPMLRKFVDTLPGLGSGAPNNLGNFIPVAHPDTTTYPGSDYYEISVRLYQHRFHSDLPPTNVRGYVQTNMGTDAGGTVNNVPPDPINWLGPVIIAVKDRPIRVKFKNELPGGVAGNLPLPVDESILGAGRGPIFPGGGVCNPSPQFVNDPGEACAHYPQTRAAIHLHGGRTPWISDGTPHQWILPIDDFNDPSNPYKRGVSLANVPDMPAPAADETTYYWSNQQSARLMFYHDHAWGITRLNVLAGEAAGLLLTDKTEGDLIAEGILPGYGTPLVIQDRTFVDASVNPATGKPYVLDTDPTWNYGSGAPDALGIRPPVTGDFWMPHVYIVAQNPYTPSGVNAFGRWVYGPWFFPPTANLIYPPVPNPYHDPNCSDPDPAVLAFCVTPNQPPVIPGTPLPSVGAETFFDTVMVNGQTFPVLNVEPKAYRFRILNAANDRFMNLNIYKADPTQVANDGRLNTEVAMCAVPGAAGPTGQVCWDAALFPNWPNDGRVEGVPNPNFLGPDILYLGTEGGFLPKPVLLTGQPLTWVGDPTFFNAGNIDMFNLFLGPAERADVIIDFTNYANQELIFYNDASAAVPAFDPRFDYVTGAPDMSDSGGYGRVPPWSTTGQFEGPQIGYAPNTRTVLKFVVGGTVTGPNTYNQANLEARWMPGTTPANRTTPLGVFEESQDQIIVGQADYNGVYTSNPTFPSVWPAWGLVRIEDTSLMFETVSGTMVTFPLEPKAMHDEMGASFDKEYARMSTNLGIQRSPPLTNTANMTPFMFTDPPSEYMNAVLEPVSAVLGDGTQLWKISHNGVDMHPIHFHIFDVQVINRVGWDGMIRLPAPTELGWKDTVRIAPLEDTTVAMRPWTPPLPFSIPFSLRPLNPAIPIGSGYGFTNIDPVTQNPLVPPTTNIITNFAWEYVWHCHILSHEENDMMRAIVLNVNSVIPPPMVAPIITAAAVGNTVTWVDPTQVNYVTQAGFGNAASEIGFRVERATTVNGPWTQVGTALANKETLADTTATAGTYYLYRVAAYNEAGTTYSAFGSIGAAPVSTITAVSIVQAAPTGTWTKSNTSTIGPTFTAQATIAGVNATAEYQFTLIRTTLANGGGTVLSTTVVKPWTSGAGANIWQMPLNQPAGISPGWYYTVRVEARNAIGGTPAVNNRSLAVIIPRPATTLTNTPNLPSPQNFGVAVQFAAVGGGTGTTTASKQYRFSTSLDNGVTWTVVSNWAVGTAVTATTSRRNWTMPTTQPRGSYLVRAEVRTNAGAVDVTTTVPYVIRTAPATGVTVVANMASPGPAPVSFLATGQGLVLTQTGVGYYFRFSTSNDAGATWTIVQPVQTGHRRLLDEPHLHDAGGHPGRDLPGPAEVTTAGVLPGTADATAQTSFTVGAPAAATGVTLTPFVASPQNSGTPVLFTAAGSGGGTGATYQYRFLLDTVEVQPFSTAATWTMPGTTVGGDHTVAVEVSTDPAPVAGQATTSVPYTIVVSPATGLTVTPSPAKSSGDGDGGGLHRAGDWRGAHVRVPVLPGLRSRSDHRSSLERHEHLDPAYVYGARELHRVRLGADVGLVCNGCFVAGDSLRHQPLAVVAGHWADRHAKPGQPAGDWYTGHLRSAGYWRDGRVRVPLLPGLWGRGGHRSGLEHHCLVGPAHIDRPRELHGIRVGAYVDAECGGFLLAGNSLRHHGTGCPARDWIDRHRHPAEPGSCSRHLPGRGPRRDTDVSVPLLRGLWRGSGHRAGLECDGYVDAAGDSRSG